MPDDCGEFHHGDDIANNVADEYGHESKVTDVINEKSSHENDLTDNVTEKSSNEDEEADEATEETKTNSIPDNLLKLRDVGTSILNQHEEDEQFIEQLVAQYDVPSHATTVEILLQIAQLSKVIGNLNDIHAIIEKNNLTLSWVLLELINQILSCIISLSGFIDITQSVT